MKKLALIAGLLLLAAVGSVVKHKVQLKSATFKIGQKRPWCTAFAVSDTLAVTAAHCVSDEDTMVLGKITMFEADDTEFGTGDMQMSKHPLLDIATVSGDFHDRNKLPISTDRFELDPNDKFDSCGFPMMDSKLVCSHVFPQSMYADSSVVGIAGPGYLIFGMSGGPVFNTTKGVVVAVNTGLREREVILSPFINIEDAVSPPSPQMIMYKLITQGLSSVWHMDMVEEFK